MGWYERWAQWSEHYRFLTDLAATLLVGVVTIVMAASTYYPDSPGGVPMALVSVAVLAPLPWCRTRPVASCVAIFVVCMLQLTVLGMAIVLPANFVAVLVSIYCVTVYGPTWAYLMACGMAVVGSATYGLTNFVRNDGMSVLAAGAPSVTIMVFLACAFAFGLVRRSRRAMLVAMRDRAERLEIERDQQAQIATSAERARIAREMHDIVAHSLSVVIAQADGGRYAAAADPAAAERSLGTIAETGRAALADMRRLLGVLREEQPGGITPLGLVAPDDFPGRSRQSGVRAGAGASRSSGTGRGGTTSGAGGPGSAGAAATPSSGSAAPLQPQPDATDVGRLVDQARDDGLRVSWARVGIDRRLPPGVGLTVFRVCQEALTNVRKHAGPRPTVTVLLRWGEAEVELRVDDDGRGLAAAGSAGPDVPVPTAGYGLLGMRERAEMFGGTLTAGPRRGGGFSVRFVVPIPRASDSPLDSTPDTPDVESPGASPEPHADPAGQNNTRGAR